MRDFDLKVPVLLSPKRVDVYLTEALGSDVSRKLVKSALDSGLVRVNGKVAKPSILLHQGDRVDGRIGDPPVSTLTGEQIPLSILYEDDSLLVVDKASGMTVHPGAGNRSGTLVNALLGRGQALSAAGGSDRPGIVHRLDKDTSGVLLVAKTDICHRKLQEQFSGRTLKKTYVALVRGRVEFEEGTIEEPIGRHAKIRDKMAVVRDPEKGRDAQTRYRVLERFANATLLELHPLTGRTHQIRVHLAHAGYPVVGDVLYGSRKEGERLALHASAIEFSHPKTGKVIKFQSPLPEDFQKMVAAQMGARR